METCSEGRSALASEAAGLKLCLLVLDLGVRTTVATDNGPAIMQLVRPKLKQAQQFKVQPVRTVQNVACTPAATTPRGSAARRGWKAAP